MFWKILMFGHMKTNKNVSLQIYERCFNVSEEFQISKKEIKEITVLVE